MLKKTLIEPTESAVNALLTIENWNKDGSLSIIGLVTTESVPVQIPRVENPVLATDEHWTNFVYDSVTYVLDVNNNRISIPFRGTYRISKPASNGNAFGIRFE